MAADRHLDRIGDDLAADEAGLHALMAHGDAVGDGDRVEPARHAAALDHARLRGIGLGVERRVAGRRIVTGARQRDEGLGDILFAEAHRIIIAAMGRAFGTDGDVTAGQAGFVELGHGDALCRESHLLRKLVTRNIARAPDGECGPQSRNTAISCRSRRLLTRRRRYRSWCDLPAAAAGSAVRSHGR